MKKKITLNEDGEVVSEELIEKKDQPRQEEDVALAEAATGGATTNKTMEEENNSDMAGAKITRSILRTRKIKKRQWRKKRS